MFTLIHTHGVAGVDYSSMSPEELSVVDRAARVQGVGIVPGVFLRREFIGGMEAVLAEFASSRGAYPGILGFSVDGPLLGSSGGVRPAGIWSPSPAEWLRIASWGPLGLKYIVMAPDGAELGDDLGGIVFREVIDAFYRNGVRIALGHFQRGDPELSARRTRDVIDYVHGAYGPAQDVLLTDHLFNDMPKNFKHAWRTPEEQAGRDAEIAEVVGLDWDTADLDEALGKVPAVLLAAARAGKLLPFLNFDGDHVDLAICAKTVRHVGAGNLIGITDDTEVATLAGEDLHQRPGSRLWFRADGIVAAGSGNLYRQIENLERIGCTGAEITAMFATNPTAALSDLRLGARA